MASKKGRVVNSWRSPEKLLMKAIAVDLYQWGLRGHAFYSAFESVVPHWRDYFSKPISENAVIQRADKAMRYLTERAAIEPYMPVASSITKQGKPMGKRTLRLAARTIAITP